MGGSFKSGAGTLDFEETDESDDEDESVPESEHEPESPDGESPDRESSDREPESPDPESPDSESVGSELADSESSDSGETSADDSGEMAVEDSDATATENSEQNDDSGTASDSTTTEYPYFVRRSSVGDERSNRLEVHVRDEVAADESEYLTDLADELDTDRVAKTDAREFALKLAHERPEEVARLMREEGYGELG